MTADEVRNHIRYSGWASGKLMEGARGLSKEDLTRGNGASHSSIEGTLSHIHFADRLWYARAVDGNEPVIREADLATLEVKWPEIQAKWQAWADALTDADMDRVLEHKSLDGTPRRTPLRTVVLHLVNHATLHRGQVVAMIRQLGIQPPVTDLIFYEWGL